MKQNPLTSIDSYFDKKWKEYLLLLPLFLWYAWSLLPYPFYQYSDGGWLWIPHFILFVEEVLQGSIPLWNEYEFAGRTLLADGNSNFLNPTSLLYFFLSPEWAYTLSCLLLFLILLIGSWEYLRIRGFTLLASLVGVTVYAYSGQVIFWSLYHGMNLVFALFPLTLFFFVKLEKTGQFRYHLLAFIALFLTLLGGFIQFAFIAVFSVFVEGIRELSLQEIKRVAILRLPTVILAVLAASVTIIPTIEAAIFSHRSMLEYPEVFPKDLFNMFRMFLLGDTKGEYLTYPNYAYYLGGVIIALSFSSFSSKALKPFIPFVLYSSLFLFIAITVTTGLIPEDFQFGVKSDPFRGMFIFSFALAILVALGFENLLHTNENKKRITPLALALVFLLPFVFVDKTVFFLLLLIIVVAALPFVLKKNNAKYLPNAFAAGIIILILFNTFPAAQHYLKANVSTKSLSTYLQKSTPFSNIEGRVLYHGKDKSYESHAVAKRIRTIGGYGSFFPKTIFEQIKSDGMQRTPYNAITHFKSNRRIDPAFLAFYGIEYLIITERNRKLAQEVGWTFISQKNDEFLFRNPFYLGRSYIQNEERVLVRSSQIIDNTNSKVTVRAEGKKGEMLILSDSWFPGWNCYVNGKDGNCFNAWGFRGYTFPEDGEVIVEWQYEPIFMIFSFYLSLLSLVLFFLYALRLKKKKALTTNVDRFSEK